MEPLFVQKFAVAKTGLVEHEPDGTFEALVSVFGNKDSQGDVTELGAFKKSLTARYKAGGSLPAVWSHQFHNPEMFLGKYTDWEETDSGLVLKGRLNLNWSVARQVYELYKEQLVTEFSWSGRVEDYDRIEKGDDLFDEENEWMNGARIKQVDLWEAGPTFKGANPQTELLSVKNTGALSFAAAKEGRVLRTEYVDVLKNARDLLTGVIESVDKSSDAETDGQKSTDSNVVVNPADAGGQVRKAVLDPRTRARMSLPID